ncbi:Putative prophage phiRv2 integrase [Nocardioides aquaticus]|uniref:Prophage phiRv2 integrase n=3 Tax=Nocardioides aquaticus TaxID=160826 RepID=A0ABX8EG84_9ACTN|nr:site-specific integrase [Nocardioides aquaticus]QVT77658.1 Putative prophage phiRv2 integrase [Nocardioides aquaticus]
MPDGTRYSRSFGSKMDAEGWLSSERALIDRDEWTPPAARKAAAELRERAAAANTVRAFSKRYLAERGLRPNTVRGYETLLASRLLPYFGELPLRDVTLSEIKAWRASLNASTESTNAAAYRLLRSLLQAAEEEELIDRAPPKIRGASGARVKRAAVPATFDELAVIIDAMPERLKLLIVLAAFVGLREGELLELRRSDVDGVTGRIDVTRKVDKDANPSARGACPKCGRPISTPKTRSGVRTVHVPPPFLKMLQQHLLQYSAEGPNGLLFPGDRTDHMSVRYLMDRYRPAREAAGRPDLTLHHLRHTALTLAGQHGATAAELQARAGHASQAAMAIYQHATLDRDRSLAEKIGVAYSDWESARSR